MTAGHQIRWSWKGGAAPPGQPAPGATSAPTGTPAAKSADQASQATPRRYFPDTAYWKPDIVTDARAYYDAITSMKSFTLVPGTGHEIEQTQAGVDAFVAAVQAAPCRVLRPSI